MNILQLWSKYCHKTYMRHKSMQCTRGIHHWANYGSFWHEALCTPSLRRPRASATSRSTSFGYRGHGYFWIRRHENDAVILREHVTVSKKILQDWLE